jgi:undecaprenyl-diphosphatase
LRGLEYRRALRAQWLWALALSCIFVALAWAVSAGLTEGFDESIHALLGSSSGFLATPRMQELGRDVTALGGTVVLTFVTLAATGYLLLARRPGAASLVAVSVVGGRTSPAGSQILPGAPAAGCAPYADLDSWSFPSGHAMSSTIVYLIVARLIMREQPQSPAKIYILAVTITLIAGSG